MTSYTFTHQLWYQTLLLYGRQELFHVGVVAVKGFQLLAQHPFSVTINSASLVTRVLRTEKEETSRIPLPPQQAAREKSTIIVISSKSTCKYINFCENIKYVQNMYKIFCLPWDIN